jgi:hypothetical protein
MASRTSGRIVIPSHPTDLLKLAEAILKKHQSDGAASALNAQQDFSWAVEGPKVAPCSTNNAEAEAAAKEAERLYRERDKDLAAIKAIVLNSAQLLKKIYAKNPKVLGDYGFVVDDSAPTTKTKK